MISVIVPAYNVEREIGRALDSILAQTCPDIEVIAVNDGSTDSTGTVLDAYARNYSRIQVIHQKNAGVTAARLAGVVAAKGEWIGFVDGDDEIEPDMYRRLLENALDHGADISHCGYQMVFPDGRIHYFHNTGKLVRQDRLSGLKDLLEGSLVEPGLCNKLFQRKLFADLVMPREIRINEDLLMNYHLFSQSQQAVFEDICPYHYLVRRDSASRAPLNHNRIWDPIRVKQAVVQLQVPGMEAYSRRAYLSTCINVYNSLMLDRTRDFAPEEPKIRRLIRENRRDIPLLSKKQQLLAGMICGLPGIYRYLYRVYAENCQKNPYI